MRKTEGRSAVATLATISALVTAMLVLPAVRATAGCSPNLDTCPESPGVVTSSLDSYLTGEAFYEPADELVGIASRLHLVARILRSPEGPRRTPDTHRY